MILKGTALVLRPWAIGDEEDLVRHANDRAVWRNLTTRFPHPYTLEDARGWLTTANAHPENSRHFAVVVDGRPIGAIGFERLQDLHTRTAEIGYWLGQAFWGRGLAAEALRIATDFAFTHYDFVRLQAGILDWNSRSCRVAEKAGYHLEARLRQSAFKDDQVCDLLMYVRLRDEHARGRR